MGQPFLECILGRLSSLGDLTSPAMFGGHALYWQDMIFGIVFRDRLYLKVDQQSRPDYESRGMGPFRPIERQTLKAYYEVPPDVLGDQDALLSWVKEAIRAGQTSSSGG
jgi:DNA transformation protein and related proteins